MAAILEHGGTVTPVTLRNLSAHGALVEGELNVVTGTAIVFRKNELSVSGKVAWTADRRAGIAFDMSLDPETLLRHVPAPRPLRCEISKRPGFSGRLSPDEWRLAEAILGGRLPSIK